MTPSKAQDPAAARAIGPDRTAALASRPWRRLLERALGPARSVPTMLSAEEQKLYYWLTAFWCEGAGEIVDLGCFAGGSTARLAEGGRVAGLGGRVHAYDRFTADPRVKEAVLYRQGAAPFEGEDILPLARAWLAPWQDRVTFHPGEIERAVWPATPIELLVMDASKTAASGDAMAAAFFPHLIPGASLVVSQDHLHWAQPWLPAQFERLADCLIPVAHAPRDTVVFLCIRAPGRAALAHARIVGLSDAELDADLAAARARLAPLGVSDRLGEARAALAANPGARQAFAFRKP